MLFDIDYWKDAPLWDVDKIDKATKVWFRYMKKRINAKCQRIFLKNININY